MTPLQLLDSDGENQAVRWFLACYGGGGDKSIGTMKLHLEMSGFEGCWPEWCNTAPAGAHLTKGGAQLWIRHLFNLEVQQATTSDERAELIARLRNIFKNEWVGDAVREAADMLEADAQQVVATPLHKLIEGMTVSIDVSTGEYDSGNRLFGVVNEVMESSGDKNGLTLLIYETTPNFKPPQQVAVTSGERAELIARLDEASSPGWTHEEIDELCGKAADMLEADAKEIEGWKADQKENLKNQCDLHEALQAKQVPMTEEQASHLFCVSSEVQHPTLFSTYKFGMRDAEKHHGITPRGEKP